MALVNVWGSSTFSSVIPGGKGVKHCGRHRLLLPELVLLHLQMFAWHRTAQNKAQIPKLSL